SNTKGEQGARWDSRAVMGLTAAALLAALLVLSESDYHQHGRPGPGRAATSAQATMIVVDKSGRTLTLLHNADVIKTYDVSLGRSPIGTKEREGDHRTPEGRYLIDSKNPKSSSHLALHVSYPDAGNRLKAQRL